MTWHAGLGVRTGWIRGLMGACVVIALAGSAMAIAGNIGFIGLIVPHMPVGCVSTTTVG
ncbi:MAG: iron chelate uptake ABC transporter family permease subunit [Symbiopectobacterium sp.]